jgi:hypothetical protein
MLPFGSDSQIGAAIQAVENRSLSGFGREIDEFAADSQSCLKVVMIIGGAMSYSHSIVFRGQINID